MVLNSGQAYLTDAAQKNSCLLLSRIIFNTLKPTGKKVFVSTITEIWPFIKVLSGVCISELKYPIITGIL